MDQAVWDQASGTARSLGLSTSQFLSRLVAETSGAIQRGALLGLEHPPASDRAPQPAAPDFSRNTHHQPAKPIAC
jgi:hypothetical protein